MDLDVGTSTGAMGAAVTDPSIAPGHGVLDAPREVTYDGAADSDVLLARARGGDDAAAEALFARYRPLVASIVLREQRVPHADADDVIALVELQFFHYLPRIRHAASFLATVANSSCRQYHRKRRREQAALTAYALLAHPSPGRRGSGEDQIIRRLDVLVGLRQIGRRCADILAAVLLGTTQRELAAQTGTPTGTVAVTASRCLRKLRAYLTASKGAAAR